MKQYLSTIKWPILITVIISILSKMIEPHFGHNTLFIYFVGLYMCVISASTKLIAQPNRTLSAAAASSIIITLTDTLAQLITFFILYPLIYSISPYHAWLSLVTDLIMKYFLLALPITFVVAYFAAVIYQRKISQNISIPVK